MRFQVASLILAIPLLAGCDRFGGQTVGGFLSKLGGEKYSETIVGTNDTVEVRILPSAWHLLSAPGLVQGRKIDKALIDSLTEKNGHAPGISFILKIRPGRKTVETADFLKNDLIFGSSDIADARQFYTVVIKSRIWIENGSARVPLAAMEMENNWAMEPGRTFMLLFPDQDINCGEIPFRLVLDEIVPGIGRRKLDWKIPSEDCRWKL